MADFYKDSVFKEWEIEYDGGVLTNRDIRSEGITFKSSLCSETSLRFGSCETSEIGFTITNNGDSFLGKEIKAKVTAEGETVKFPPVRITSDVLNADRTSRVIRGYDAMNEIINADMTEWYNSLSFPIKIKDLRKSFVEHFGLTQKKVSLPNDDFYVNKKELDSVTGKDIITSICEMNACFGHIGNDGEFEYIFLDRNLTPSESLLPNNYIYPGATGATFGNTYKTMSYADYAVMPVDGVKIETDEGNEYIYGSGTNIYHFGSSLLFSNKSDIELDAMASNFISYAGNAVFIPCEIEARGNPKLQVGDRVEVTHKNGTTINTIVMSRTLTGSQALSDSLSSSMTEYQQSNNNSVTTKISNLYSRSDWAKRMIDENTVVVGRLVADHVSVSDLEATNIKVDGKLDANQLSAEVAKLGYATVGQLDAQKARIDQLSAKAITTDNLYSQIAGLSSLRVTGLEITNDRFKMTYNGQDLFVGFKSVGGETVLAIL